MAPGYGFQVFLRVAIQNQIRIAQRVIVENKKSEPFSYREKVRIFCFNGSPPGRRSYGSKNRALTKAPLGLLLPRLRQGRAVQVLLSA